MFSEEATHGYQKDELLDAPVFEGELIEDDENVPLLSELSTEEGQEASVYAVFFLKKLVRIRGVRISREDFLRQELQKAHLLLPVIRSRREFLRSVWTNWPMTRFLMKRRNRPLSHLSLVFRVGSQWWGPCPLTWRSITFTRFGSCKSLRICMDGKNS